MPNEKLSIAEVKAALSDQIRAVERGSAIMITRHGTAVAARVRPED